MKTKQTIRLEADYGFGWAGLKESATEPLARATLRYKRAEAKAEGTKSKYRLVRLTETREVLCV